MKAKGAAMTEREKELVEALRTLVNLFTNSDAEDNDIHKAYIYARTLLAHVDREAEAEAEEEPVIDFSGDGQILWSLNERSGNDN